MKKSKQGFLSGSIGAAVIATSIFAAPSAMAEKGMWEMSVAANIESSTSTVTTDFGSFSSDTTQTFITADVGRYFTPKLVGRVSASMFGSDDGQGNSSLGTNVGAGIKFYFGEGAKSKWVPFVQGGLNIAIYDGGTFTASGMGIVGGGGVSHFLTEEVSLDISGQYYYDYMTMDTVGSPTLENDGLRILFGLTARY